jgi:hypothetical protein
MQKKMSALAQRALVAVPALWTLMSAATASAGQRRLEASTVDPATPEPAAMLVFGLGLGVVAWSARRRKP